MAGQNAISEYRNVKIEFGNARTETVSAPIDAYKAALEVTSRLEAQYAKLGAAGVPNLTDKLIYATGNLPFQIHKFSITTDMAAGSYSIFYTGTQSNVD